MIIFLTKIHFDKNPYSIISSIKGVKLSKLKLGGDRMQVYENEPGPGAYWLSDPRPDGSFFQSEPGPGWAYNADQGSGSIKKDVAVGGFIMLKDPGTGWYKLSEPGPGLYQLSEPNPGPYPLLKDPGPGLYRLNDPGPSV